MQKKSKRYFFIAVDHKLPLQYKTVKVTLFKVFSSLFGEFGLAKINFRVIIVGRNFVILSCNRGMEQQVRCGLLMLNSIEGLNARAITVKTSGTLRSLKNMIKEISK